MKSIYISSTREDLEAYREAVIEALRKCRYTVESMENYSARGRLPKEAVEEDVRKCDIYVGIFAWRYGYVPEEGNPDKKSITEFEYIAAGQSGRPRLIFILSDEAPWPASLRDAEREGGDGGARIREFRRALKRENWIDEFKSPDELAKKVLIAVLLQDSLKRAEALEALDEVNNAAELGASFLPNIEAKMAELRAADVVALRLGPTPWWDTRLYLVAALATDFTTIQQFVFLDADRRFLAMSSPGAIRQALARKFPQFEIAYQQSRGSAAGAQAQGLNSIIAQYPNMLSQGFGGQPEMLIKAVVTPLSLKGLGINSQAAIIEQDGLNNPVSSREMVQHHEPYVALVRQGRLERLVDREQLASRIARQALQ